MSKKKIKLKVGNFYMIYANGAHPSFVFEHDAEHNTFVSLKFGTSGGKHMVEIHPIQEGYEKAFVNSRPFEGTRNDYGKYILIGLYINPDDEAVLNEIKKKPPHLTKNAKKRHKKSR